MELIMEEKWKEMEEKMEERWARRKAIIEKRCKDILEAALQAKCKEMDEEMEQEFMKKKIEIQSRWKKKCDTLQEGLVDITGKTLQGKCKEIELVIEERWMEKQAEMQEGWRRKMETLETQWRNILRETLKEKCSRLTQNMESYWNASDSSTSDNLCREGETIHENGKIENKLTTEKNLVEKCIQGEIHVREKTRISLEDGTRQGIQNTEYTGHLGNEVCGITGGEEQISGRTIKKEETQGYGKRHTNTNPESGPETVMRNETKNDTTVVETNTNVQASIATVLQCNYESEGDMEDRLCKEKESDSKRTSTSDTEDRQNSEKVLENLAEDSVVKEQSLPLTVQSTQHSSPEKKTEKEDSRKLYSLLKQSSTSATSAVNLLGEESTRSFCSTPPLFPSEEHTATSGSRSLVGGGSPNNENQSHTLTISGQSTSFPDKRFQEEKEPEKSSGSSPKHVRRGSTVGELLGGEESTNRSKASSPSKTDTEEKRSGFADELAAGQEESTEKENEEDKEEDEEEENEELRFLPHRQLILRRMADQQRVGAQQIRKAVRLWERCTNKEDEVDALHATEAELRRGRKLARKLLAAAREGDADRVVSLWHAGAYTGAPDRSGETALHAAAARGHEAVVRALLAVPPGDRHCGGADASARDALGRTALHRAAARGHHGCVQLLADAAPDGVDAQDARGRTALHEATEKGYTKTVSILMKNGASPSLRDAHGRTALNTAAAASKEARGATAAARNLLCSFMMMYSLDRDA